jgi:hypothetical protein
MSFIVIILLVLAAVNGFIHNGRYQTTKFATRPRGAEIFQKNNPVREFMDTVFGVWAEAFAPVSDNLNRERLRKMPSFKPTSLDSYKDNAKSGFRQDELKERCAATWGIDYKTKKYLVL